MDTKQPEGVDVRVYIRPEGGHYVGLCGELQAIVTGSTVEEVVSRTKQLAEHECGTTTRAREPRVAVHLSEQRDAQRP